RAALIEAINDYSGAVILVSHDRFLLEACADRLWLVAKGEVNPFDGDLDDYRRLVLGGDPGMAAERNDPAETRVSRADLRRPAAARGALAGGGGRKGAASSRRTSGLSTNEIR